MEWRCEWCGKPHAEDDPPCDNCGHGTFERAIVREAPGSDSTTLWVCTACGREHPKHNPPCSRCGNPTLERRERTVDEADVTAPSYLDLLTPRYALGFVAAIVLGTVLLLGLAGIVDLPGLGDEPVPEVTDVPGNADSIDGVATAAIEAGYLDRFNERRSTAGASQLERHERLDAIATFYNQRRVTRDFSGEQLPPSEQLNDLLEGPCRSEVGIVPLTVSLPDDDTAAAIGRTLADTNEADDPAQLPAELGRTGLDVHAAPDGSLYLTQFTC